MDTSIRGAWIGLDAGHDREALLYSAVEGVAFATADVYDSLAVAHELDGVVRLAGGGTVVPAWRQLLADALRVPLEVVEVSEASARGAGLLAAQTAGLIDEAEIVRASSRQRGGAAPSVVPGDQADRLRERRARYRAALQGLHPSTAAEMSSHARRTP